MKNKAIEMMMAIQHNVDPSDVRVEFTHAIGSKNHSESHFEVTIWTEDKYEKFEIIVKSKLIG